MSHLNWSRFIGAMVLACAAGAGLSMTAFTSIVAPDASPGIAGTSPAKAVPVTVRPAREMTLALTYRQRMLLPAGTPISVVVAQLDGTKLDAVVAEVPRRAPPYTVSVTLPHGFNAPIRLSAAMTPSRGPRLERSQTLTPAQMATDKPIEIVLSPAS